jgi:hypothetical protein
VTYPAGQSPSHEQVFAARVFHPDRHAIAAIVFYLNYHASKQALAARIFHLNDHVIVEACAPRVFNPNCCDSASGVFHRSPHAIGQAVATDRFFDELRSWWRVLLGAGCSMLLTMRTGLRVGHLKRMWMQTTCPILLISLEIFRVFCIAWRQKCPQIMRTPDLAAKATGNRV